ncbi:MAG TPA: PAS domain S-box protein, partial [Methanocella sp.]
IRQHGSMTFESRLRARDGHEFPVEVYANFIALYGSSYYTVSARDITERKEAERSRAFLASVVHTAYDAIFSITPEGIITSWNQGAEKLYGFTADEMIGNYAAMLAPPDRQTEVSEALERMRSEGMPQHYETVRQRKDGTLIDISLTLSPIVDASGAFVGSSAIVHDISERKRNERALKESEANLSQAQRMAHIGNWTWDTKKDRIYGSDEFYRIFGMPRQDYITYGQFIDTVNPEDRDSVNTAVDATLQKGEYYKIDYRVIRQDGAEHTVHAEGKVHLDAAGKPDRMFGTVQDVTERKNAEEILEKYRLFSENAHDIVLFIRRDGRILEANAAAVKAYGYAYEELLSLSIYNLRALDIGYHIDEQMEMAYDNGILFEAVHRRKDGSDFPVEVSSQGRTINGQRVLLSVVRDITERKRVEEALCESESNLKRAEEIAMIGNWNWDLVTNRISWSEETYVVWGLKPGEIQPSFDLVVTNVHPDDREFFVTSVNASLYEHHPLSMDFRIIRPDGSLAYVHNEAEILYSPDGKPVRMFGTAQDITERKLIEEALQVAKAQAELYVDLMGHDINNMNMVAMGTLEIALMDMGQDGKLDSSSKPLLDKSLESLKNSSALIRNVQKLQRASVEGIKLQTVDVADVLKGIIDEQRSALGKGVTIYYKNEATSCLVTANELLRDVFTNIISNAIKHSGPDRHLTIGVAVESIVVDGRKFCRVAIDDNGSGIPDPVKDRLFRRFSRGETKAKGSGLGLYLVKTLVEHYGGNIRVEDRVPGDYSKGAKFVVTIPSVE